MNLSVASVFPLVSETHSRIASISDYVFGCSVLICNKKADTGLIFSFFLECWRELMLEPTVHQESTKMSFSAFVRLLHSSFLWSDSVYKWRKHCPGCQENENLGHNFYKWHKSMQCSSLPEQCWICLIHNITVYLFYVDQYFQDAMGGRRRKTPPLKVNMNIWADYHAHAEFVKAELTHCGDRELQGKSYLISLPPSLHHSLPVTQIHLCSDFFFA